jgi:putative hydrolase of the HAD superfamily
VFFVDADNTLWDTNAIYAAAQEKLLARVEKEVGLTVHEPDRLRFVRGIDQSLAGRHHLGLKYPPSLLAQALAFALSGGSLEKAAIRALKNPSAGTLDEATAEAIGKAFLRDIQAPPSLLPGVSEGLRNLREAGATVLIVTEDEKHRVEKIADSLGISSLIDRVISGPKRRELFCRVLRLAGQPKEAFMIGDQISRDIGPAKAAGLTTVYVPGAFIPHWEKSESRTSIDIEAQRFDQAVAKALSHGLLA